VLSSSAAAGVNFESQKSARIVVQVFIRSAQQFFFSRRIIEPPQQAHKRWLRTAIAAASIRIWGLKTRTSVPWPEQVPEGYQV